MTECENHSTTLFYFQLVAEFFRMGYAENRTRAAAGPHGARKNRPERTQDHGGQKQGT